MKKYTASNLYSKRPVFTRSVQSLTLNFPTGLIVVWLLALPVVAPFVQSTLPRSADGLLHLYRVVALDQAIRQGALLPRWLPDLAYGYGLPLFVFYAPLSYYLVETLHLLDLNFISAYNAAFGLALLMGATGVYLFTRDLFGPQAGILAGVAYVYAPYQLVNAIFRGSLPAVWAAAIFPFAFWAFSRLRRTGRLNYLVLSAVLCALALLSHNISNLLFFPLLLLYLTVDSLAHFRQGKQSHLPALVAVILGLGLAAFFWLPAVVEKEFVHIERVITPPDFAYHTHYLSLSDLVTLPSPANTGLLNPDFPLTLGVGQIALAATGMLSVSFWTLKRLRPKSNDKSPLLHRSPAPLLKIWLFVVISLVVVIFMMLPLSVGIWDRLPLIAFVQHPSRLLGVAAFLLAILVGISVVKVPERLRLGYMVGGVGLMFISAVPLLYPRYYDPLPASPTLAGMMAYERAIGAIGTTSFGEYLPYWVEQTPRESPLVPMYQAGSPIERLDLAYLPAQATIDSSAYGFNQAEVVIDSPQPYQAIFHTFYFPGWRAQLDGKPAAVAPVTERGLIGLDVPAGRHRLQLIFTETPIRLVANGVSVVSLAVVIFILFKMRRGPRPYPVRPRLPPATLVISQFVTLVALALVLILTKIVYLDRFDNPLKRAFDGVTVQGVDQPRQVNFGSQLNLLGYDLKDQILTDGETFEVTLYWQARQPLQTDYSILAQLVDEQQHLFSGQDNLHPGGLPTSHWEPWTFTQDAHDVPIPPGTPPGDYFLITGPYDPKTGTRLPVVAGGTASWGDVVPIPVVVTKSPQPPTIAELEIEWPVSETFEISKSSKISQIKLLGATPERDVIVRDDFLRIALFWEAITTLTIDYQVNLQLLAGDDQVMLEATHHPSHGRYPTSRWTAGQRIRDNHDFWIPANFPVGTYDFRVRLVDETGGALSKWIELGTISAID